jgi:hypothetical protein
LPQVAKGSGLCHQVISINTLRHRVLAHGKASKRRDSTPITSFDHTVREQTHDGLSLNFKRLGATSVVQPGVVALGMGWAIPREPRLDLSHACSLECINTYGLVSMRGWQALKCLPFKSIG